MSIDVDHIDALLEAILRCPDPATTIASLRAVGQDDESLAAVIAPIADRIQQMVASDLGAATLLARRFVDIADRLAQPGLAARARIAQAVTLTYGNHFVEAIEVLADATSFATSADDPVLAARSQLARMHAFARLGRLDDAATTGEAALAEFLRCGQPALAARAEANLGVIERMRQRPTRAIERFASAIRAWPAEPIGRAQLQSNLAEALLDADRFSEAEGSFRTALAELEAVGATQAATIVEGNLADLLARQGRLNEALLHFERVRRRYTELEARGDAARLQAEQADAFAQTGLFAEAITEYRSALGQLQLHGMVAEAARARLGLAKSLLRAGRIAEATLALQELPASDDMPPLLRGRAALVRGRHAIALRDFARAEAQFRDAIRLLEERPAEQAIARHGLADALLSLRKRVEAEVEIDQALRSARRWLMRPLEADLLHLRAKALLAGGHEDAAIEALRSATMGIESLRGSLQAERLRSAFTARHASASAELAIALVRRGDEASLREALEVSERVRGRALLDLVARAVDLRDVAAAQSEDPSAAALLREAADAQHQLNALFSRLDREPGDRVGVEWRASVLTLEERLRVIESRLGATHRLGELLVSAPDATTMLATVRPGTALVSYLIADGRLTAIVVLNGRWVGEELGEIDEISERIERWRFAIHRCLGVGGSVGGRAATLDADAHRALREVCRLVFAPLWPHLSHASSLQIVPAGPLHAVPFHALPVSAEPHSEGIDGEPLLARMAVATVPSVGVLVALRARPTTRPTQKVIIGVADDAAPAITFEAETLAFSHPGSTLLLDRDATLAKVREAAGGAGVLHLACHGRFVAESPMRSGLRLADGWLTATDLYSMRLPRSLVILSACDTGRVAVDGGEELHGLLRGFFVAGASGVVLSGWPVHDAATIELMTDLHVRCDVGARSGVDPTISDDRSGVRESSVFSVADALRAATLGLRARRVRIAEWAAFSFVGDVGGGS